MISVPYPIPFSSLSDLRGSPAFATCDYQLPCMLLFQLSTKFRTSNEFLVPRRRKLEGSRLRLSTIVAASSLLTDSPRNGVYTVGDFMTKKEELHVVKPTTMVDEALEILVENRISGFPVIDDNWKLIGLVSDYDLLALDSISGTIRPDTNMFPQVDSSWKTFNEVQKLLSKTYGKVIGDLMTPAPMVVRESTNLEDAARLLLKTKFHRLPVVDSDGRLVGIITRGNVVRAALQIKRATEGKKGLNPL